MSGAELAERDLLRLVEAASDTAQPGGLLRGIDGVARRMVGAIAFTANRFHADTMEVARLYSTHPAAYPIGGRKPKRDTAWGRHVLLERRVFVGEGEPAIRAAFDDHALIASLGVRSIINVPVVFAGTCLGTLNFMLPGERVAATAVANATLLGLVAAAAFRPV